MRGVSLLRREVCPSLPRKREPRISVTCPLFMPGQAWAPGFREATGSSGRRLDYSLRRDEETAFLPRTIGRSGYSILTWISLSTTRTG